MHLMRATRGMTIITTDINIFYFNLYLKVMLLSYYVYCHTTLNHVVNTSSMNTQYVIITVH